MSLESIIIALIAALPGLIALIGTLKKDSATASKTSSEREQLEAEITEKVLTRADTEIVKLNQRISSLESDLSKERIARQTLEVELAAERKARVELEARLTTAQQRISALEDELDKRNARIKELESARGGGAGGLMGSKR